jgi:hypothetical protein
MMDNTLIELLEARLSVAQAAHEKAKLDLQQAQAKEAQAAKAVQSYQAALDMERAETGVQPRTPSPESQPFSLAPSDADGADAANKKTNVVRAWMLARTEGFRIRDLASFLRERGLDNNPTFPYSVTGRLQKRGELTLSNGRLFATEKMRQRLEAQK